MWYPPPVLVPIYLEPRARVYADVSVAVMRPVAPFDQHLCFTVNDLAGYREHWLSEEDGRKFLLSKSVYDLVKVSHFLELTDPKLLGWYLSLPAEDRKLIQEEGGLLQFLHRHPALDVSKHIVHLKQHIIGTRLTLPAPAMSSKLDSSRRASLYGVLLCENCGTSCPSGAKKCRRCNTLILNPEENFCISEEEKSLQLLPNNIREELTLLKSKGHVSEDMSVRSSQQFDCIKSTSKSFSATQTNLLNSFQQLEQPRKNSGDGQLLCQMWEERVQCDGKIFRVFKDPSAQASFSLDRELEMQSHKSGDHDQVSLLPDTNSDFPNLEEGTLPEYYSFNTTIMEHTSAQWSNATNTSMMADKGSTMASESVACAAANGSFPDSASFLSNSSEWTDLTEDCESLSNEDDLDCVRKTDEYHSVNEEDTSSSAACGQWIEPGRSASGQCSREGEFTYEGGMSPASLSELNVNTTTACGVSVSLGVSRAVDASNDFRAWFTSPQATEITQDFFVRHCQDVSTGSDSCLVSQHTQTIQRPTSEKCTITEVYMSDLDAVCEEFGKLGKMEEELMHLKDERARSGSGSAGGPRSEQQKSHCGCDAVPRARWAELRLLALQFAMCQQHCWRHFYTSPQSATSLQGTEALPNAMSQTLKSLEDNYLKIKSKILEGVPLDDLKPLSVDSKRLTAATSYRPSMIYEALLGDIMPVNSFNVNIRRSSSLEGEGQNNQGNEVLKINSTDREHINKNTAPPRHDSATSKTGRSKLCGDEFGSSQQPGVSLDSKPGAPKDLNSSDAWFDAEEELDSDSHRCKEEKQAGQRDQRGSKKEQKVDATRKKKKCFLLCVSNLPDNVTECDLLLWFAKYHTSQVSLSNFSNTRVALVSLRNSKDAEAAVKEMNGHSVQGHVLYVEHIHKFPADGQATIKESYVQRSPAANKAGSAKEGPITHGTNNNFPAFRPLRCSLDKLTNICPTPTASGTCVPQHYGTMGSFDTIMAQLLERHPKISRERIVSTLLELRAKHHGVLGGLPLSEIVDMTSELLVRSNTG